MMYLWIKAAHIIFVVAWMAGLLVYPRYKIHQLSAKPGDQLFETMKEASARLRRVILTPSLILVWILGISLIAQNPSVFVGGWLWVKLALVVGETCTGCGSIRAARLLRENRQIGRSRRFHNCCSHLEVDE